MLAQMGGHAAQYLRGRPLLAFVGEESLALVRGEGAQQQFVVHGFVEEGHGEIGWYGEIIVGMRFQAGDIPGLGLVEVLEML